MRASFTRLRREVAERTEAVTRCSSDSSDEKREKATRGERNRCERADDERDDTRTIPLSTANICRERPRTSAEASFAGANPPLLRPIGK